MSTGDAVIVRSEVVAPTCSTFPLRLMEQAPLFATLTPIRPRGPNVRERKHTTDFSGGTIEKSAGAIPRVLMPQQPFPGRGMDVDRPPAVRISDVQGTAVNARHDVVAKDFLRRPGRRGRAVVQQQHLRSRGRKLLD